MTSSERLRYIEAHPRSTAGWPSDREPSGVLVLLHAFPLGARMWEPQLALAEEGWHVVAPDLRGFNGGRLQGAAAMTMEDYASDVADLLQTLGVRHAVIGGLSMGGYVTLALYRRAPELFRGLVLADTRAEADTPEGRLGRERMIALARTAGAAGIADDMLPRLLGATTHATRPATGPLVRGLIQSNAPDVIAAALHAMMTRSDSTHLLPSVTAPTLVLVGEEDVLTPPPLSASMATAISDAELVVLPQAGHLASLEQPQLFNAAVARFLHRL